MPRRELVALVAVPLVLAAIVWAPRWVFLTLAGTVIVVAGRELLTMARGSGIAVGRWLPSIALAGVLVSSWWYGTIGLAAAVITVVIVLPTARLAREDAPKGGLGGAAVDCFSVLLLGATGACFGWLWLWPQNDLAVWLMVFYLGTIWLGDSGAYYVGSRFGRRPMSPRISPNKTWEGLAGGVAATFAAAAVFKLILPLDLPWPHVLALATVLAVAAPLGDLVESQYKRDTGVKDSSGLLPGHGGMLDRTDSLLYAAPPTLGYLMVVGIIA